MSTYNAGDVVNGHVLTSDGRWLPLRQPEEPVPQDSTATSAGASAQPPAGEPVGDRPSRRWSAVTHSTAAMVALGVAGATVVFVVLLVVAGLVMSRSGGSSTTTSAEPNRVDGEAAAAEAADFAKITSRQWAAIARDPQAHAGERITVYAVVTQIDAATGQDVLRANVGATQPSEEYENDTNTIVRGEPVREADLMVGDVLRVAAAVDGALDYENIMGGETTAVVLTAVQIDEVGYLDLTGDVRIGDPVADDFGGVSVPVTVTNSGERVFDYSVEVAATSPNGSTQYETSSAFVSSLEPGQSARQEVAFFEDIPDRAVFRVVEVSRMQ